MVTEQTVLDVMRLMNDEQRVIIFDEETYKPNSCIFQGQSQFIPVEMYHKTVSKIYSDYINAVPESGSYIGIRIVKN